MDDEHVQPLLEDDDQPSWVTLAKEGEGGSGSNNGGSSSPLSSPWDQAAARLSAIQTNGGSAPSGRQESSDDDDLPRIVLLMRLGNMGAAGLLIFGSVRYDLYDMYLVSFIMSIIFSYQCVQSS